MATTISVDNLVKELGESVEVKDALTERIAGLREILRHFDKAGQLSAEQSTWLAKAFPAKTRKTPEERRAELEAQLAKLAENGVEPDDEE